MIEHLGGEAPLHKHQRLFVLVLRGAIGIFQVFQQLAGLVRREAKYLVRPSQPAHGLDQLVPDRFADCIEMRNKTT